ncbi:hypothetical protein RRG08_009114 [Elysia crispata]|uniref:Uncharacterized protein n=1 Tax=Elysia crispata TaxID=231223 RepID=A0AAE1D1X9_9GAST|nr:hypothetical protein RRG08_009114 [Elysia crispata]
MESTGERKYWHNGSENGGGDIVGIDTLDRKILCSRRSCPQQTTSSTCRLVVAAREQQPPQTPSVDCIRTNYSPTRQVWGLKQQKHVTVYLSSARTCHLTFLPNSTCLYLPFKSSCI